MPILVEAFSTHHNLPQEGHLVHGEILLLPGDHLPDAQPFLYRCNPQHPGLTDGNNVCCQPVDVEGLKLK